MVRACGPYHVWNKDVHTHFGSSMSGGFMGCTVRDAGLDMAVRPECAWILESGPRDYSLWTLTCYLLRSLYSISRIWNSSRLCLWCNCIMTFAFRFIGVKSRCLCLWLVYCMCVHVCVCMWMHASVRGCVDVCESMTLLTPGINICLVIRSQVVIRNYRC